MPSSSGAPTVALHLNGQHDQKLVTVPVRRMELDGTFVLAVRHPIDLPVGRVLTISVPSDLDWQIQRVRVEKPRFRPHEDAGLLRLTVIPGGGALDPDADEPGGSAAEATPDADVPQAAGQARVRGELRAWQGRHPLTNVALRLNSGRVRTMNLRHVDDEGALVLAAKRPSILTDGAEVQIAWSDRRGWLTATTLVAASRPEGHPDAGLLRLALRADPQEQKERRSGPRKAIRLALRGSVERGAPTIKGSRFESNTLDVSIGGAALTSGLDLARGDRLRVRLIGSDGQLPGGEVLAEVLRIESLPDPSQRKVVVIWRDVPAELQRSLRRLIESTS